MWKELADSGWLRPNVSTLVELGQALWYGDMAPAMLRGDVEARAPELLPRLERALWSLSRERERALWEVADIFYSTFMRPKRRVAIDLDPYAEAAHKLDLNVPTNWVEQFDVVHNSGTAEHVFNQCQLFATVHQLCAQGGLMVHSLPCWGWVNHGFYNYQPTLVTDLAAANDYEVVRWLLSWATRIEPHVVQVSSVWVESPKQIIEMWRTRAGSDATMHVALHKRSDKPFTMPMQGRYAQPAD
jgi:hypothetical protein